MIWLFGALLCTAFIFILFKIRRRNLLRTVTTFRRGTRTERDLVLKLLKFGIPAEMIFHDLYLRKPTGNYAQIDLVVVTAAGLIVFEVKDFSGWIFGTGYKQQWVQVLAYGKVKYRFYNPILQNSKHVQDLRKELKQENIPMFSVVVFYGDCVLKDINFVPAGTFVAKSERILKVIKAIATQNSPARYNNKTEVMRILREAVENGNNAATQSRHIENVKDMLGRDRIFD